MKRKHEICNMQILLIAATEHEIGPFTAVNNHIDTLITGIGVPATIYHLQKRIQQVEYRNIDQHRQQCGLLGVKKSGQAITVIRADQMKYKTRQDIGERADTADLERQRGDPERQMRLVQPALAIQHQTRPVMALHDVLCERCVGAGYRGRLCVFEILEHLDEIRELIVEKTDVLKIDQAEIRAGMTTMVDDGVAKCRAGVTSPAELLRVKTVR